SLEKKVAIDTNGKLDIAVLNLPHISNFTDFDPLEREDIVSLRYIKEANAVGNPHVLIIPGSKNTIEDLNYLKSKGYLDEIKRLEKNGGTIVGICGGFQMLGKTISDHYGVESSRESIEGLGLLDMETQFENKKTTFQVEAEEIKDEDKKKSPEVVRGYEIHMGKTKLNSAKSLFKIKKRSGKKCLVYDGAVCRDGKVWGTYIHGVFDNDRFRRKFLHKISKKENLPIKKTAGDFEYDTFKEEQYDKLADLVRKNLDMKQIYKLVGS
ncbi:MAG: cobyric acid synthase CobQ, partial [Deltaproteobacteria bacterium]|nr:cobyric acid synthase CobQ [Deltaproteobacteria bacterium]